MKPTSINIIIAYLAYFSVGVLFVSSIPLLKAETSLFLILITSISGNYWINRAYLHLDPISNLLLSNICALFSSLVMIFVLTLVLFFTEFSLIQITDLPSPIAPLAIIYLIINLAIQEVMVHLKNVKSLVLE